MNRLAPVFILLLVCLLFKSCVTDDGTQTAVDPYQAVMMDRESFENSVEAQPARNVENSGKIYIMDQLMFISEKNEGFHVYDYADPENPVSLGYIQIKGATDLAIRDGNIYINQAIDLVTMAYNSSNNTIQIMHRNENVFPQKVSPNGTMANTSGNEIVVNWIIP